MGKGATGGVVQLLMTASLLRGVCAAVICSALPFEACKEVKCDISRLLLPSPKQRLQACLARLMQGHCKQLSIDQHQKTVTLCFGRNDCLDDFVY